MAKYFNIIFNLKKIKYVVMFTLLIVFYSCSGNKNSKQFEYAGGTFTFTLANEPTTLLARNVSDVYSATLLNQIYQGLVILNPKTLKVEPSIAKSWDISEDGKTIKFHLRDDVYFHTSNQFPDGDKLTPEDVIFSIELACTPLKGKECYAYSALYKNIIEGAQDFFNKKTDHIEGLSIEGNSVIFKLKYADMNFIDKLAQPYASVLSKKVIKAGSETDLIGTGPFKFIGYSEVEGQTNIQLVKNENYYQKDDEGNQLPYLDSLIFKVETRSLKQLEMFEEGKVLLIDGLPPSRISMMLGEGKIKEFNSTPPKLILVRKPLMGTQYYFFNLLDKKFKDVRVRKAFNYAIDRQSIVTQVLHNQAYGRGNGGIVPPAAFKGYDAEEIKNHSYTYDPQKAKKLFAEAGYPDGKGFPDIDLKFNTGTIYSAVADHIARQLKQVLNVNVTLDGMSFQNLIEDAENAHGDLFRMSWYADYYSPESFLLNGYGGIVPDDPSKPSQTNFSRYKNPKFDEAFEKAVSAPDIIDRYKYFAEAESILMDDAPFIILWYDETIKIVYSKVRNLHFNEMNYYSFKDVYIKEWTKKEWEEKHSKK